MISNYNWVVLPQTDADAHLLISSCADSTLTILTNIHKHRVGQSIKLKKACLHLLFPKSCAWSSHGVFWPPFERQSLHFDLSLPTSRERKECSFLIKISLLLRQWPLGFAPCLSYFQLKWRLHRDHFIAILLRATFANSQKCPFVWYCMLIKHNELLCRRSWWLTWMTLSQPCPKSATWIHVGQAWWQESQILPQL